MNTVEKLVTGAFGLIILYLLFNSQNANEIITGIGSTSAGLFGTLQGRSVTFPGGVSINS
jgi:hypothetical protein